MLNFELTRVSEEQEGQELGEEGIPPEFAKRFADEGGLPFDNYLDQV